LSRFCCRTTATSSPLSIPIPAAQFPKYIAPLPTILSKRRTRHKEKLVL
jgi:hypothetical protein